MAIDDVNARALWWAGPLTIVASVLLVWATRLLAFALLDLPADFPPLTYGGLAFFTVAGNLDAVADVFRGEGLQGQI